MHPLEDLTARLLENARREPELTGGELPPWFATRVLAQLRECTESPWEFLAIRSVPVAAGVAIICAFLFLGSEPVPDDARLADLVVTTLLEP